MSTDFEGFPKIPRLFRDVVITEKIDGTNAQILITEDGELTAGSRTRYITPQTDNFGFATWCEENKQELLKLGPGRYFGEWWGQGIQRGYGLKEKRFSLFHTQGILELPKCCHVVPTLYEGLFEIEMVEETLRRLKIYGSVAVLGFMQPEGIVIYHKAAGHCFKVTLDNDQTKGQQ